MSYISEAFKAMDELKEDTFNFDKEGVKQLEDFMDMCGDVECEYNTVIDPYAETEDELEKSYNGKVIMQCNVCKSLIYKGEDEVVVEEGADLANTEEECPFCHSVSGYKVIGMVQDYDPNKADDEETEEVEVKEEEKAEEVVEESVEKEVKESALSDKAKAYLKAKKPLKESEETEEVVEVEGNDKDDRYKRWEAFDLAHYGKVTEKTKRMFGENKEEETEVMEESLNRKKSVKRLHENKRLKLNKKSIKESFNKVDIETDDQKMSMTSDENGEVVVTTKPIKKEEKEREVIKPVPAEVKDEIVSKEEEPETLEIDEFEETDFDTLGEGFLKRNYKNVESFKTTGGVVDSNRIKLEGIIKFTSGKQAKTSFLFEKKYSTKSGKIKFVGENLQISKDRKAFTLTTKAEGKKLFIESLTYNYREKDDKGFSNRLYGSIKNRK